MSKTELNKAFTNFRRHWRPPSQISLATELLMVPSAPSLSKQYNVGSVPSISCEWIRFDPTQTLLHSDPHLWNSFIKEFGDGICPYYRIVMFCRYGSPSSRIVPYDVTEGRSHLCGMSQESPLCIVADSGACASRLYASLSTP